MARLVLLTNAPKAAALAHLARCPALREHVLAPNRRAGDALGCESRQLEQLAESCCPQRVAEAWTARRALREAVREELGAAQPERTAQLMEPALRRLLRADAPLAELLRTASPRVRHLARVGLAYRGRLGGQVLDKADLLPHATRQAGLPRRPRLVYGYGRLERAEYRFLNAVCGDGSVLILPGGEHPLLADNAAVAAALAAEGWEVERAGRLPETLGERLAARLLGESVTIAPSELAEQVYHDPEAEVRGVLGQVKELLKSGVGAQQVVVVARDEERYASLLDAVAQEYGLPLNREQTRPLTETRLGAWLRLVVEIIVRDWPFEATVRLLGQRLTALEQAPLAQALASRTQGAAAWQALAGDHPLVAALAECPTEAEVSAWVAWLRKALEAAEAPRRFAVWAAEALASERLQDALDALGQEGGARPLSREGFAAELLELLETTTTRADPRRHGVAFRSPLAVFGASYEYVLVLGAAEGLLPAALSDDPYLDAHERAGLTAAGCPQESAAEAALRERLSFYLLLQTVGRRLVLARPQVIDRRPALPSPFIAELAALRETPPERYASEAELRRVLLGDGPVEQRAASALRVELSRESEAPADQYDGVVGRAIARESFSLSELLVLGQCPFRWLAGRVLGLTEVDEAAAEPDALDRGNLLHRALELTLRAALQLGQLGDREAMVALLPAALDAAVGQPPPADTPAGAALAAALAARTERNPVGRWSELPHWPLLRAEHLVTLTRAVRGEDFLEPGAEPIDFEVSVAGLWNGLAVRGRIDRIDRLADGGRLVVDYKSRGGSGRPRGIQDDSGKLTCDLQLEVYRRLCSTAGGAPVRATYYNLRSGLRASQPRNDPTPRLLAFAAEVIERLDQGDFAVRPDVDELACEYCDLELLCRAGARLARKPR